MVFQLLRRWEREGKLIPHSRTFGNHRRYRMGCDTEVVSFEQELCKDVITLMTVFSARLYGKRSHKNKLQIAA
jgi:predicted site-specific integrase-resolvase